MIFGGSITVCTTLDQLSNAIHIDLDPMSYMDPSPLFRHDLFYDFYSIHVFVRILSIPTVFSLGATIVVKPDLYFNNRYTQLAASNHKLSDERKRIKVSAKTAFFPKERTS